MGIREKQKEARRDQVLDAARKLIRATGGTDFSMRLLAEEAGMSLVTPYNLFGSKSGVLYSLLNDSLERIDQIAESKPSSRPVDAVIELAGIAADTYARDARFYRPLLQFLVGVRDSEHRPRLFEQSLVRWNRAVDAAIEGRLLPSRIERTFLARQLMITFIGAVELWIHEELDDDAFLAQSLYGSTLLVLANAPPEAQPRLIERLRKIERQLPKRLAALGECPQAGETDQRSAA